MNDLRGPEVSTDLGVMVLPKRRIGKSVYNQLEERSVRRRVLGLMV